MDAVGVGAGEVPGGARLLHREYRPEGGAEVALVDTMARAYFLQLHWTGESAKRPRADPRRHSLEYTESRRFKTESGKDRMWYPGDWEIPYASELPCMEQAVPSWR